MINWQYYPKLDKAPQHLTTVVNVFLDRKKKIDSSRNKLKSDEVLAILRAGLTQAGFVVEKSKKASDKIRVPVLFGRNGQVEKSFEADAFNENTATVLEVEAGRGVTNFQFLKDLFQACLMHNVSYLVIAVRNVYGNSQDFKKVLAFFDSVYASGRLVLPLKGILIIGY